MLDYNPAWLASLPDKAIELFAGTGNPFLLGEIKAGQRVIDIGCGAGLDCLIAARMAGSNGAVIGFDLLRTKPHVPAQRVHLIFRPRLSGKVEYRKRANLENYGSVPT